MFSCRYTHYTHFIGICIQENAPNEKAKHLLDQLSKFGYDENEINAAVQRVKNKENINEIMDEIEREREKKENEVMLESKLAASKSKELDQLIAFGFDKEASLIALELTGNDVNAASAYLTDSDFMANLKNQQQPKQMSPLEQLIDLGFDAKIAFDTLQKFDNDLRKATEYLIGNTVVNNEQRAIILGKMDTLGLTDD